MNSFVKLTLALLLIAVMGACESDFENKFDQLPDERIQNKLGELKETLCSSENGWLLTYSMGDGIEMSTYGYAIFNKDNTVKLQLKHVNGAIVTTTSEYKLLAEGDIELVFNTHTLNITNYANPDPQNRRPRGYGADIEFNLKTLDTEVIRLEGKVYKGKMMLQKATKEEAEDEFAMLDASRTQLINQRTARYMTLAITNGLGATTAEPLHIGLDCSTIARVAEIDYNYNGEYNTMRKYLFFTHRGFGLSNPFNVGGEDIQYFKYNEVNKRFELNHPTMEGYIYCDVLPKYYIDGLYDEFMNKFSVKLTRSYGKVWDTYIAMKKNNPVIKSFVLATDYKRRIPLFDDEGNPVLDDVYNHDYKLGEDLGDGLLFSFHLREQFYFYYVPIEVQKIEEDRIRLVRKTGEFCTEDAKDPSIGEAIKNNKEFQDFVNYICNDKGWMIRKTQEAGNLDFNFYSLEDPKNYFYSRLY